MKNYNIYKKRDGQSFEQISSIYADNFEDAKKEFAKNMTNDNWNKNNDIIWLNKERDGVKETGWYDFNGGQLEFNEETDKYNADDAENYLMVSEEAINEGFDYWNEDVYTWEIRDNFDIEVWHDGELCEVTSVESLKQADEIYPSCDGYEVREIEIIIN